MTENFFPEEEKKKNKYGKDGAKNLPVSVYVPNDAREKIDELLPKMGFENLHQYLQHSAMYFLSEYIKNPKILKTTETIEKPKF